MPNPTDEKIIEQLTRCADALERLADDFDHNNRQGFVTELLRHIDVISQKHR